MRIRTRDVPQADALQDVVVAVAAVAEGHNSFQDISEALGKGPRQGRYYRLAAEILGFIAPSGPNESQLTAGGRALLGAEADARGSILTHAVLQTRLFQRVVPFLEACSAEGCSRRRLEGFIRAITEPTGPTMIPRRTSTVTAWLSDIGMLDRTADRYYLRPLSMPAVPVEYAADDEPLLPTDWNLAEYREVARRTKQAHGMIRYAVDEASRERASADHEALTALVAGRLRAQGAVPRRNRFIDLAARVQDQLFMFEIKTTTCTNARSQVRHGVAQLYEYRYLQGVPVANLVLVIQHPLPAELRWMHAYLSEDRGILPVWDGDLRTLHCGRRHRGQLGFLL